MAIEGYFRLADPAPAPYVQAHIYLPRLGLGGAAHFLVDTGSDITSLHGDDIDKLGLDIGSLSGETATVAGVGGQATYAREPAPMSSSKTGRQAAPTGSPYG